MCVFTYLRLRSLTLSLAPTTSALVSGLNHSAYTSTLNVDRLYNISQHRSTRSGLGVGSVLSLGISLSDVPCQEEAKKKVTVVQRRHSFHVLSTFEDVDRLTPAEMDVDVQLCAQFLVMRRRQVHLKNVMKMLEMVTEASSASNALLKQEYESRKEELEALALKSSQLTSSISGALTSSAAISRATNALSYESTAFSIPRLWATASVPRHRVFAIRELATGTGQQRAGWIYGSFNRVQRGRGGAERMVDWLGRTEVEAEDEAGLPQLGAAAAAEVVKSREAETVQRSTSAYLLRLFSKWGAVLGVRSKNDAGQQREQEGVLIDTSSQ